MIFLDEGVYVNTYGKVTKNVILQWGEMPSSVGKFIRRNSEPTFSIHIDEPNHGLGQQGHRDPLGRHGPSGRRLHAQEGPEAEVPMREKRQSFLLVGEGRWRVADLFHDPQQTGNLELVDNQRPPPLSGHTSRFYYVFNLINKPFQDIYELSSKYRFLYIIRHVVIERNSCLRQNIWVCAKAFFLL